MLQNQQANRRMQTLCEQSMGISLVAETKLAEFANSVDLDEVAHNEPPRLDLHYLLSSL